MQIERFHQYIEDLSNSHDSSEIIHEVKRVFEKIKALEELFLHYHKACKEQDVGGNSLPITVQFSYFSSMNEESINEIRYLIKTSVIHMCDNGQYKSAFELLGILLDKRGKFMDLWVEKEITILYIFSHISKEEVLMGHKPILSTFETVDSMKECYYRLKFLLRRLQYSLPDNLKNELVSFVKGNKISDTALQILAFQYMNIENEEEFALMLKKIFENPINIRADGLDEKRDLPPFVDSAHTFSFIICVNDRFYFDESVHYIYNLDIPEGYTIEVIPIYGASSMTSGYNEGMKKQLDIIKYTCIKMYF